MYPIVIEPGVELILENTVGEEMYVVEDGEFVVIVKGKETNNLYKGDVFGELSLLHGIPRTATKVATRRSQVWSAEQKSFSCIRIRDQLFLDTLTREAVEADKEIMKLIKSANDQRNITISNQLYI